MIRRLFVLTLILLLGACARVHPIQNIDSHPVVTGSGKTLTANEVRKAIIEAAVGKGWRLKKTGPRRMEAKVLVRKHGATITIEYSRRNYSIKYKSSHKLNKKGNLIHGTYNRWIRGLVIKIDQKLVLL